MPKAAKHVHADQSVTTKASRQSWRSTTAQHSAVSHAQSSEARTCRSECDNESKQTELARASMLLNIYGYLQLAVISKSARNRNQPNVWEPGEI